MESLSRLLIQSIFPDLDLSERERQNSSGKGWIAAFVVDELGRAKLDSYLPASFAQGVAALREAGRWTTSTPAWRERKKNLPSAVTPSPISQSRKSKANKPHRAPRPIRPWIGVISMKRRASRAVRSEKRRTTRVWTGTWLCEPAKSSVAILMTLCKPQTIL